MIISLAEKFRIMWLWCYDATNTCLISLIWANFCRCTCLPYLVVRDLVEMEISILISILTWITWEKLDSLPRSAISRDFQIKNTNLQFQQNWQKNNNRLQSMRMMMMMMMMMIKIITICYNNIYNNCYIYICDNNKNSIKNTFLLPLLKIWEQRKIFYHDNYNNKKLADKGDLCP